MAHERGWRETFNDSNLDNDDEKWWKEMEKKFLICQMYFFSLSVPLYLLLIQFSILQSHRFCIWNGNEKRAFDVGES